MLSELRRDDGKPIVVTWTRNGMAGTSDAEVAVANATSQAVAESISVMGYDVRFVWADPEAEEVQRESTSSFYRRFED